MGSFMETLYDVLFRPAQSLREIAAGRKLSQSFGAFFLSMLIPLWAMYLGLKTIGMHGAMPVIAVMQVAGGFIFWFAGAAVFGLTAELFGGKGSSAGLFAAMGFVHIPRLITIPLLVLAMLVSPGLRPFVLAGTAILVMLWTLYLEMLAIKGAYGISGSKAVLVMIFPVIAIFFLLFSIAVIIGVSAISAVPMRWM